MSKRETDCVCGRSHNPKPRWGANLRPSIVLLRLTPNKKICRSTMSTMTYYPQMYDWLQTHKLHKRDGRHWIEATDKPAHIFIPRNRKT